MLSYPIIIVGVIVVIYLLNSINILPEYERGVIFRLGRLLPEAKGPGVILVFAPIDRIVRISLRQEALEVPPQDIITAEGEFSAAQRLVDAAKLLATEPVSVQLRYLQTLAEIGVEKNTTVIFPIPVDFFSGIQKLLGKPGGDL